MSVGSLGLYRPDGRIRGTFVYMLLCHDGGPLYVKVGITDTPHQRLLALRNGCPVKPKIFAMMETPSRRRAATIERALHAAFDEWRIHGEWFVMSFADRAVFNERWRRVVGQYALPNWPARWTQIPVEPVIAHGQQQRRWFAKKIRRRGKAFRDFSRHVASG